MAASRVYVPSGVPVAFLIYGRLNKTSRWPFSNDYLHSRYPRVGKIVSTCILTYLNLDMLAMNNWKSHINVASSFSISKYEMEKAYRGSLVEHFYGPGLKEAYIASIYQVDEETVETGSDFIFLGSKITADGD